MCVCVCVWVCVCPEKCPSFIIHPNAMSQTLDMGSLPVKKYRHRVNLSLCHLLQRNLYLMPQIPVLMYWVWPDFYKFPDQPLANAPFHCFRGGL